MTVRYPELPKFVRVQDSETDEVTEIGRPQAGNIAYVLPRGKFVGYVSLGAETSWHDLN